jgi:hypothetical protein
MNIHIVSTIYLELSTDWIPIEERVPPNNEVLFLLKNERTGISRCRVCKYSDFEEYKRDNESVTHWKEIPY